MISIFMATFVFDFFFLLVDFIKIGHIIFCAITILHALKNFHINFKTFNNINILPDYCFSPTRLLLLSHIYASLSSPLLSHNPPHFFPLSSAYSLSIAAYKTHFQTLAQSPTVCFCWCIFYYGFFFVEWRLAIGWGRFDVLGLRRWRLNNGDWKQICQICDVRSQLWVFLKSPSLGLSLVKGIFMQ